MGFIPEVLNNIMQADRDNQLELYIYRSRAVT